MSKSGVRAPTSTRTRAKPPQAEPQRANRAQAVADLLPDIGRAAFRKFGFIQSSVVSRWSEIVGERYAHVSAPESIRFPHGKREGGTLTVVVRGAHAPMMQHITPEVLERVNRFFGYAAVAKVAIRQGDLPGAESRRAPPSLRAPTGLDMIPMDLGDSLRTIADPELRAVLEGLAVSVAATRTLPVLGKVK